jgi:hypothetical protein
MHCITITLRPSSYDFDIDKQLLLALAELYDLKDEITFSLVVELTKAFNIHFHGIVEYKGFTNQSHLRLLHYAFRAKKVIGHVCIKPMSDIEGWRTYMYKDIEETKLHLPNTVLIHSKGMDTFLQLAVAEQIPKDNVKSCEAACVRQEVLQKPKKKTGDSRREGAPARFPLNVRNSKKTIKQIHCSGIPPKEEDIGEYLF